MTMPGSPPLIVAFIRTPGLREALVQHSAGVDLRVAEHAPAPNSAVAEIAELQPALLVVELEPASLDWLKYVRSDPATRRLPVIAVGEGEASAETASSLHAPMFSSSDLIAALPGVLLDYARAVVDAEQLAAQCAAEPPPLVVKGLHEFNAGEYFECHETLEHAWMAEHGPVRDLYRVVLQVAVAYDQITRGNFAGAHKMFLRSIQWFAPLPDHCQGIDVAQLRADVAVVRAHLETLGPSRIDEFDRALLKPVRFTLEGNP
jgi:predicted metal-dependent hydrolase